jgi:hypothetical protein
MPFGERCTKQGLAEEDTATDDQQIHGAVIL